MTMHDTIPRAATEALAVSARQRRKPGRPAALGGVAVDHLVTGAGVLAMRGHRGRAGARPPGHDHSPRPPLVAVGAPLRVAPPARTQHPHS
jgi:hypothetical protein